MTVEWNQNKDCKWLISGGCVIPTNQSDESVIDYLMMQTKMTYTKTASRIASKWGPKVDSDGFIYMRFYTTNSTGGKITVNSTAPEEVDPEPIVYPMATIFVTCSDDPTPAGQAYVVRVSKTQTLTLDGTTNWTQNPNETHPLQLSPGTHVLQNNEGEELKIEVK